jgi:hypothetical protein
VNVIDGFAAILHAADLEVPPCVPTRKPQRPRPDSHIPPRLGS